MGMAPTQAELDAVKRQFYDEGVSVVDWARQHGFDVHLVYGVLSGRSRASRGESHRIAVALGLKSPRSPFLVREVSEDAVLPPAASATAITNDGREAR